MTDALKAHLKLMEQLSDRITTHRTDEARGKGFKYSHAEKVELKHRLIACIRRGMNRKQACMECGCSDKSARRLLGAVRRRRKCK